MENTNDTAVLKSTLIRKGATKEVQSRHPEWDDRTAEPFAIYTLTAIIADLTSSNKADREFAKRSVRELVKLGKEAGE